MSFSDKLFGPFERASRDLESTGRQLDWLLQGLAGNETEAIRSENAVGNELAQQFFETFPQLENDEYANYISRIHNWLLEKGVHRLDSRFAAPERKWHVHVVETDSLLGACLPGGYIFMSQALIDYSKQDQNEVAFILAHETSHVLLAHARKRTQKLMAMRVGTSAIPGITVGRAIFARIASGIVANLVDSAYSKGDEFEADQMAVRICRRAGFDPRGGIRSLERIRDEFGDLSELPVVKYFTQHPPIDKRVETMEKAITS